MLSNTRKVKDRSLAIDAAGILVSAGDTIEDCMPKDNRPQTPEKIRTFRRNILPDVGKPRMNVTKLKQLQKAANTTHGVKTSSSESAAGLVNPQPQPVVQQILQGRKEGQIYLSQKKSPLGKSHNQRNNLPSDLDLDAARFGVKVVKDEFAGDAINPRKSHKEIEEESVNNHNLYLKSHAAYEPGEQKIRNYTYESYNINKSYGVPTPHSNDGIHVSKALHWITDSNKGAKIINSQVEDFHEKSQPQLGKVFDPIADSMKISKDHTFGIVIKQDEYGAGDLLHGRNPKDYLRGKDRLRGVIATIRRHLKVANYYNFENLRSAFNSYDRDGSGTIDMEEMRSICLKFNLPIERELMEELIYYCDSNGDGVIDYNEFANFLNWQDDLPSPDARTAVIDGKGQQPVPQDNLVKLRKHIDQAAVDMRTSSQIINTVVGDVPTREWRSYGVPTIRTDIPPPRVRRVSDMKNYGDESDAYGLISPSSASTQGVYENDFLSPRSKEEIRDIFHVIGYKFSDEEFHRIWNEIIQLHPNGHVCVDTFKKYLDSRAEAANQAKFAQIFAR